MDSTCYRTDELGDLCHLDESDPRLAHARICPRCRSLLITVRAFETAQSASPGAAPGARPDEADRCLAAVVAQELERWGGEAGASEQSAPHRPSAGRGGAWSKLWAPALRPAWGIAVLAVIALGVAVLQPGPPEEQAIRGEREQSSVGPELLAVTSPDPESILFQWRGVAGADLYEIRFFDPGLNLLLTLPAGTDTLLRVPAERLRTASPAAGKRLLWQIVALRHGDHIGVSSPGGFELP